MSKWEFVLIACVIASCVPIPQPPPEEQPAREVESPKPVVTPTPAPAPTPSPTPSNCELEVERLTEEADHYRKQRDEYISKPCECYCE